MASSPSSSSTRASTPRRSPPLVGTSTPTGSPSRGDTPRSGTPSGRGRTWVPLFVSQPPNSPLITATVLPPTPRREGFSYTPPQPPSPTDSIGSTSSSGSGSGTEDDGVELSQMSSAGTARSSGVVPRLASPVIGKQDATTTMQRSWSNSGGAGVRGSRATGMASNGQGRDPHQQHVRKRSSQSVVMPMPGLGVAIPGSATMERLQSMTSFMSGPGLHAYYHDDEKLDPRRPSHTSKYRRQMLDEKKRVWARVIRGSFIFLSGLIAISCLNLIFSFGLFPSTTTDINSALPPWLDNVIPSSLHGALSLIETVPYSTRTHPTTPVKGDQITLSEYLTTRLGSHFSVPLANTPSHLWLSPASNESVRITTPHLKAFVEGLDGQSVKDNLARLRGGKGSSKDKDQDGRPGLWKGLISPIQTAQENKRKSADKLAPRRKLVTLCLDEGCMDYCRGNEGWYCFGGFEMGKVTGDKMRRAREMIKMMAAIEVLTSGRRLFVVDGDVYFRDDPLLYMGELDEYDIQIPDSWSSSHTKAGFVFLNPTENVISLWRRLLEIARIDDEEEIRSWASTNLLLDPTGSNRHGKHAPIGNVTDNLFDDDTDAVASGYGQTEFESPWAGGLDVKVLDRKRFRTSTGRLDGHAFSRAMASQALYFQCTCCEDQVTTDYIAGALGYHQPAVSFPTPRSQGGVPHFPMMITTPSLNGTEEELAFALGLILQSSHDTSRSFVPPLDGRVVTEAGIRERYIWRMFPAARWAKGGTHDYRSASGLKKLDVDVLEPHYVQHAIDFLEDVHSDNDAAKLSVADLNETLFIDPSRYTDYKDFLQTIIRPYYSTTRVIVFDNVASVMGRPGWDLRPEFSGMEMCWEDPTADEDSKCTKHCMKKPSADWSKLTV
ncbi:hypothetical protein T439DRAFT_353309 [Meredithblackwellia eburnea MCA 4105]